MLHASIQTTFVMKDSEAAFFQRLGQRIVDLRKQQGLTQTDLATLLQVTQQAVASYEVGRRRIPVSFLPALAEALAVSIEDLLATEQRPSKRGPTPKLHQKIDQISRLPRSTQQYVLQFLDQVIATANSQPKAA
jgi:transcriptional regulator with XRE-family HTH domain